MKVSITTLSENTANYGYLAEWGLSILIEADGLKILVDTGLSFSSAYNAQLLGIDLSTIDFIVLSHGHPDHTGGLRDVLKRSGDVEVIAHPDIWSKKYVRLNGKSKEQYDGIPFTREELELSGACFNLSRNPVRISNRIITTGEIPMLNSYEKIEDNLFIKEGGKFQQDNLADELALVIDTELGLVVILGCAHRGIVNTLIHAQNLTGKDIVYAAIGGSHLFRASEECIEQTIADLRKMNIKKLGLSHCTGFQAATRLHKQFEGAFFVNNAGTQLTLP